MFRAVSFAATTILAIVVVIVCQQKPADDELISAARKVTDSYMGELKMALSSALSQGGVVGAVDVCSELAPVVARKYSSAIGWEVKRVSNKFRNQINSPDEFESKGMEIIEGKTDVNDEYYSWENDGGKYVFRYLRAIKTGEMCLNCHGDPSTFGAELKQILDTKYPNDNATGFKEGDFRGAFSIRINWPDGKTGVDSINQTL